MRIAVIVLGLLAVFGAGWQCSNWHRDSVQLNIERLATEISRKQDEQFKKISADSARQLESKLSELNANEKHTETIFRTEIIKPVFNNICVSDEFIRVYNDAAESAERTLSRK